MSVLLCSSSEKEYLSSLQVLQSAKIHDVMGMNLQFPKLELLALIYSISSPSRPIASRLSEVSPFSYIFCLCLSLPDLHRFTFCFLQIPLVSLGPSSPHHYSSCSTCLKRYLLVYLLIYTQLHSCKWTNHPKPLFAVYLSSKYSSIHLINF